MKSSSSKRGRESLTEDELLARALQEEEDSRLAKKMSSFDPRPRVGAFDDGRGAVPLVGHFPREYDRRDAFDEARAFTARYRREYDRRDASDHGRGAAPPWAGRYRQDFDRVRAEQRRGFPFMLVAGSPFRQEREMT